MIQKHLLRFYMVLILSSLFAGCQKPSPTITPTTATLPPVSTQVSTDTPVPPTSTATRTVTPTPAWTHTPFPTATPTATPTAAPTTAPALPLPPGIVYRESGSFWLVNDQGESLFLLKAPPKAKLSYDGHYAVYDAGDEVFLVDPATDERIDLDFNDEYAMCCPQWWPGRSDAVLVQVQLGSQMMGMFPETIPAVIIPNERKVYLLGDHPTYDTPAISPDGKMVAYSQGCEPRIYEWDAGSRMFDVADYGFPKFDEICVGEPVWSPSGRQLAWYVGGLLDGERQLGVGIFNLDEQTSRFLYPYDLLHKFDRDYEGRLEWSADEKHFVLYSHPESMWWVLAVDGTEVYSSTNQPDLELDFHSSWTPDGQWLILVSYDKKGRPDRTVFLSIDGTERHELDVGGNPVWSPDGHQVILSNIWLVKVGEWIPQRLDLPPGSLVVDWLDPQDVK